MADREMQSVRSEERHMRLARELWDVALRHNREGVPTSELVGVVAHVVGQTLAVAGLPMTEHVQSVVLGNVEEGHRRTLETIGEAGQSPSGTA